MNIAIDTSPLTNQHSDRGVGQYTKILLEVLGEYSPDIHVQEIKKSVLVAPNTDIVHYPYFDPFFLTLPFIKRFKTIVTVHDLTPLVFSTHFPRGIRGELKWQIQKMSLQGATRIITDSNSSKNDIVRLIKIPKDRIDVVRIAPSKIYTPMAVSPAKALVRTVNPKIKDFILYVGDINWNKNVEGIVRSFSLITKNNASVDLVLVGNVFKKTDFLRVKKLLNVISSLHLENRVILPGYIAPETLRAFYSLALCFVFPSFYEGYGLPPIEAMSCGCPVVFGNKGSLPEIHGNEVLVNPYSIESIAMGIKQTMGRGSDASMGKHRRIVWAKTFSGKRMAEETKASYEKALE
ncbi:glycosyltransferase family 4 protein [Candidatus Gottesmanbacteria bacterium]|nr:glycosyltransferase family 4 protein [Candidatus Gottesmanbacteria bacterium]